jgi:hypothetical protein
MGVKIVKIIQTNCMDDVKEVCQEIYTHYHAKLDEMPEYSENPYNLIVTKQ